MLLLGLFIFSLTLHFLGSPFLASCNSVRPVPCSQCHGEHYTHYGYHHHNHNIIITIITITNTITITIIMTNGQLAPIT